MLDKEKMRIENTLYWHASGSVTLDKLSTCGAMCVCLEMGHVADTRRVCDVENDYIQYLINVCSRLE